MYLTSQYLIFTLSELPAGKPGPRTLIRQMIMIWTAFSSGSVQCGWLATHLYIPHFYHSFDAIYSWHQFFWLYLYLWKIFSFSGRPYIWSGKLYNKITIDLDVSHSDLLSSVLVMYGMIWIFAHQLPLWCVTDKLFEIVQYSIQLRMCLTPKIGFVVK